VRAVEAQRRAVAAGPGHVSARRHLHIHRANLAATLLNLGRPREVLALAEPAADDALATRSDDLILRADLLCRCITAVRMDRSVPSAERAERSHALADRAIACLRRAVDDGLRAEEVLARSSFDVLRRRDDYREVIAALREKRATEAK
jgi:hypothetical protein